MSSRSAKWLILGTALLMALPVVAVASTSRVEGLGIPGDYIKDYSNIYTYLSNVCCVGNLVYGEIGNDNFPAGTQDRAVGAVLGNLWDGRYGTWGLHLRETTPQLGQGDKTSNTNIGVQGADPNVNDNQALQLQWGKKFGSTSLGLEYYRSYGRVENTPIDYKVGSVPDTLLDPNTHRNINGVGVGLGFEMNPQTTVEVSLLYESRTFELNNAAGKFENDGAGAYQIAGRLFWQWQPNVMVVPVFKYYSLDMSTKGVPIHGSLVDSTLKGWQAGVAGNWTLGTNDLFVLGATFAQNKWEGSFSNMKVTETMTPALFAALETHLNPWLTARFGATKGAFYRVETKAPGAVTTEKVTTSPFDMFLGIGMKISSLQMDMTLDPQVLHNGPYFVTGSTVDGPVFPKITATYSF